MVTSWYWKESWMMKKRRINEKYRCHKGGGTFAYQQERVNINERPGNMQPERQNITPYYKVILNSSKIPYKPED